MRAERDVQNILACQYSTDVFCVSSLSHATSVLFLMFRKLHLLFFFFRKGPYVLLL